jgi:hypothetical protein
VSRLDGGTLVRVHALIERYGIHRDDALLPISILHIARSEGWRIEYRSGMGSAIAMAFVIGPIRLMYLNDNLTLAAQRVGIAHEMAHVLCCHDVSADAWMMHGREAEGWSDATERQEDEAKLVATMLLIPPWLKDAPLSDVEVATTCLVTTGAVRRFRGAYGDELLMTGA